MLSKADLKFRITLSSMPFTSWFSRILLSSSRLIRRLLGAAMMNHWPLREAMAVQFSSKRTATRLAELIVSFFKLVECLAMVGQHSPLNPCLSAGRLACLSMFANGA